MQARKGITFSVNAKDPDSEARAGTLATRRTVLHTPVFMPVATHGVVRGQRLSEVAQIGFPILLANTYHLLLRPGTSTFTKFGGIHNFIHWPNSVLTDSGGFQLFSLAKSIKVTEDGATFTSYIDGAKIHLTPERSISTQRAIDSDIMMVLDHVMPSLSERTPMQEAMARTFRWAQRSLDARGDSTQALFGIIQGGCFLDLRKESASQICSIPLDGYAIGGVAVGEDKNTRDEIVGFTAKLLPPELPRYLMGVGTPIDLLEGVARGVDMFDCILPNSLAPHGKAFGYTGRINLLRRVYAELDEPIDRNCTCPTCRTHSRAYLHQLLKTSEPSANTLIGLHNLHFYYDLMSRIRASIVEGSFHSFYQEHQPLLAQSDIEYPTSPEKPRPKPLRREKGNYEVIQRDGHISIRHRSSGEVLHSVSEPLDEARRLYVLQPKLVDRLSERPEDPFVIWDVGLGAATNAMAAILCYEEALQHSSTNSIHLAPLRIVSFENDLDALALTLKNPSSFIHIRHQAPKDLIKTGKWSSSDGRISWELRRGDFLAILEADELPHPDLVYYDPFSYKTNPELWTWKTFSTIFSFSIPDRTTLITYSASTAIRAALLAAGFKVAFGAPSGPKANTTVATRGIRPEYETRYLSQEWLATWERSDNPYPPGLSSTQIDQFRSAVRVHFT